MVRIFFKNIVLFFNNFDIIILVSKRCFMLLMSFFYLFSNNLNKIIIGDSLYFYLFGANNSFSNIISLYNFFYRINNI